MKTASIQPVVSEKALALIESRGTYVFEVPAHLNKIEVAKKVTEQFKVKVASVNISNSKGKAKVSIVKRGRKQLKGQRAGVKKAYVKLLKGESIKLFEEPKTEKKAKKGKK